MSFIRVTASRSKQVLFIRTDTIRAIDKNPENDLETVLHTNILSAHGPVMYSVLEKGDDIADACAQAEKDQVVVPRETPRLRQ